MFYDLEMNTIQRHEYNPGAFSVSFSVPSFFLCFSHKLGERAAVQGYRIVEWGTEEC